MHTYSTNYTTREKVTATLMLLAIGLAYATHFGLKWAELPIPPVVVSVPSVMGWYEILLKAYQHYLWKKALSTFPLSSIPDFSGHWVGEIDSDSQAEKTPVNVVIEQDWLNIKVVFKTKTSCSESISASLRSSSHPLLVYEYLNDPMKAPEEMKMHRGTARLSLVSSNALEGRYYNDQQNRMTSGKVFLKRENTDKEVNKDGDI